MSQPINTTTHVLLRRFVLTPIRKTFFCLISLVFALIPSLFQSGEKKEKQNRIRAKLTNESDPSSPYRAVEVLDQPQIELDKKVKTLADIPDVCLQRYAEKEIMGVREILDVEEEKQPNGKVFKKYIMGEYQFTTYRQAHARIEAIGLGLLSVRVKTGDKILLFSETRPEWLLTAFAAFRHGITLVTLLPTLDEEGVRHGINESGITVIVTTQELISSKLNKILGDIDKVRHIVYCPARTKAEAEKVPQDKHNIQFIPLGQFEEQGKVAYFDEVTSNKRPEKKDIAVIMYTSGSTGPPKGTCITHENILAAMTGQKERVFPAVDTDNDIYISYLPLGHIFGLCCELLVFFMGVKYGYSSPYTLTEQSTAIKRGQKGDLQVLRPHIMPSVPTILERIYKALNLKLKEANFFQRQLFNFAYTIKVARLEHGLKSPILDRLLFSRFNKQVLGGRVRALLSGGAILPREVQLFAETTLCVTIFQGYGLTETCAGGTIVDQYDISLGRAGYPIVSCELRLIDWEEGRYKTSDKPNPRGEILIGGKVVADSYFGDAAEENKNFKEIDGTRYFYTGDIGEVFPDGTFKIIDRKKDVVKLRGGKYVSLAKIEMAIKNVSSIDNSCACAKSSKEYPIALLCPNPKDMERFTEKHFHQKDWKKLVDDEQFNAKILEKVQDACRDNGLADFEIPRRVKVVTDSWTPESGLVNDALKLKRKALGEKYQDEIDELFEDKSDEKEKKKDS